MSKFRLKLDMSTFFNDERKLVYVLVDPNWDYVDCLQQHVEKIFDVQNMRFLTDDGCFIPPKESIEVIKTNDVLKAIISSGSVVKTEKKHKKLKTVTDGELYCSEDLKKRKHLNGDTVFTSSTPNNSKKIKKTNAVSSTVETIDVSLNNRPHLSNEEESNASGDISRSVRELREIWDSKIKSKSNCDSQSSMSTSSKITSTNKSLKEAKRMEQHISPTDCMSVPELVSLMQDTQNTQSIEGNKNEDIEKRKRKRSHRRNDKTSEYFNNVEIESSNQQNCSSVKQPSKYFQISGKKSKCDHTKVHIFFDKSGGMHNDSESRNEVSVTSEKTVVPTRRVIFKCLLSNNSIESELKPRIFEINRSFRTKVPKSPAKLTENAISPLITTNNTVSENNSMSTIPSIKSRRSRRKKPHIEIQEIVLLKEADKVPLPVIKACSVEAHNESSVIEIDSFYDENNGNEDESEVIELNATEDDSKLELEESKEIGKASRAEDISFDLTSSKILPLSEALVGFPAFGDIILFKIFRLDSSCVPGISNFITGKCEEINEKENTVKCLVIDGIEEIGEVPSKFACQLDDEKKDNSRLKHLKLALNEMLEARIFRMT